MEPGRCAARDETRRAAQRAGPGQAAGKGVMPMSEADTATQADGTCRAACSASSSPGPAAPVSCWSRDFPGGADQVREARHWVEDLLPECDPLADLLLLASELCTNAVAH